MIPEIDHMAESLMRLADDRPFVGGIDTHMRFILFNVWT